MKTLPQLLVLVVPLLFAGRVYGAAPEQKEGGGDRDTVIIIRRGDHGGGWLGVAIAETKDTAGAKVASVAKGSPAEKAGLKVGDVILEVNGKRIADRWDLLEAVREADPGTKAALLVMRGGKRQTLNATLEEGPGRFSTMIPPVPPNLPHIPHRPLVMHFAGTDDSYGLSLADLTDQLAEYFGAPDKRGVLVEEVEKGSPGEKAGFKAGDVIVAVGKDSVEDAGEVWSALDHFKEGEKAEIQVLRRGTVQTLGLTIPAENDRASRREFFGPRHFRHDFHWDSERFERQMKQLEERLGRLGKDLHERMKDVEKRIRERFAKIEV